jgi:predicted membrane-bound spermidine synthase
MRFQRDYLGETLFACMALAAGMLGGLQFTVASRIAVGAETAFDVVQSEQDITGLRAGTLYALDLLGACVGAMAISGYLAPVFGFARAAAVMAVVAAGPAVLAVFLPRCGPDC